MQDETRTHTHTTHAAAPLLRRCALHIAAAAVHGYYFVCSFLLRGTILDTLVGPRVYTETYIFRYFYEQYLVLFTMVPRKIVYRVSAAIRIHTTWCLTTAVVAVSIVTEINGTLYSRPSRWYATWPSSDEAIGGTPNQVVVDRFI